MARIAAFPQQRAPQALVTDRDGLDVWPKVAFTTSIELRSLTLPTLLAREGIDITRYDALVMDTHRARSCSC